MPDQTPPTAPCGNVLVSLGSTLMCTLPHGHPGGHTDGGAIWAYASEAPRVVDVDSLAIEGLAEEEQRDFLDSPDVRPSAELLAERDKSRLLEWKLVSANRQIDRWRKHLPGPLYLTLRRLLADEQHPIQDPGSLYDWDKELVTPVRKYADMERDLAVAVAEIAAIRALHVKERGDLHDEYVDRCAHCTEICAGTILWPCPTIRTLNGDTDA